VRRALGQWGALTADPTSPTLVAIQILFVCTANQCRSALAESILRHRLAARGARGVEIGSAGSRVAGQPATAQACAAAGAIGVDLSHHRSRVLDASLIEQADLVIGASRRHVREVVTIVPGAFTKTFTLRELVRRASAMEPRDGDLPFDTWVHRVGAGRQTADLLADLDADDLADPTGRSSATHRRFVVELDELIEQLCGVGFGPEMRRRPRRAQPLRAAVPDVDARSA
jgi:protein-tyrosine phosphatase